MRPLSIELFFPNRSWHWHDHLAHRYGRLLEERTVKRDIFRGHARGGKSLLEPSANSVAIERKHLRQNPHRLIHRINDGARDALVDDFRNGTMAECEDGCAARHRLDHHQAERLRPIDRE